MQELLASLQQIHQSDHKGIIEQRLAEFTLQQDTDDLSWFGELCFCLLTSNARSMTAVAVQQELGVSGFLNAPEHQLVATLRKHNHRFHNTKSRRIVESRQHIDIKSKVQQKIKHTSVFAARDMLASEIKGIGMKEASHYLRNMGYFDCAILDRHVMAILVEHGILRQMPKTLTPKKYKEIEEIYLNVCAQGQLDPGYVDFYMLHMRNAQIVK